jgi:hypothetical protein
MSTATATAIATKLAHALGLAGQGFRVFPLVPDSKKPLIPDNWRQLATTDPATIKRWWTETPNANIGMPTDGLVVLDVDPRKGGDKTFEELEAACKVADNEFTKTRVHQTRSDGHHIIYRQPKDRTIAGCNDMLGKGIDVKATGGYIVGPGSIVPDDDGQPKRYTVFRSDPIVELPTWLVELCTTARARSAAAGKRVVEEDDWAVARSRQHLADNGEDASEGNRENVAVRLSNRFYDFAASLNTCRELLTEWNDNRAFPPLEPDDIDRIAGSTQKNRDKAIGCDHPKAPGFEAVEIAPRPGQSPTLATQGLVLNKSDVATDSYSNAVYAVAKSSLMPAWNELKQVAVFRASTLPWDEKYGRVLNDHVLRIVRLLLANKHLDVGYQPGRDNLFEALMTEAYSARFNPVCEYLDDLQWDGKQRVPQLFARYFNCGDDAYVRAVSTCFMVGAVRRQRRPGCKFDNMPILRSPQGWMKSSAIRALFGADWFSDANLGSLRDKDAAMLLRGIWCQEFAELEGLNRADATALKAFCSRAVDRQRDPYGRAPEDVPRRCVFVGTTNESGFLKDSTGSRRFWPLDVGAPIDVARIAADRNQLWAEASHLEAQGTSDVLPQVLWGEAAERAADQTSGDPWTDTLQAYLDNGGIEMSGTPLPPLERVHTSELFRALGIATADQTKDKSQRLRNVMESAPIGWHYRRALRVPGSDRVLPGYTRDKLASK